MRKKRHNYTPEEKVSSLRRHLADHVPVSDLCDEYQLQPTIFYNEHRRSAQILFEQLQREGYEGGYDTLRRYVAAWKQTKEAATVRAFIPLAYSRRCLSVRLEL